MIAVLEAGEQSARRFADLFVERFATDGGAVSLDDAGQGRWRVTLYLSAAADAAAVRDLAVAAGIKHTKPRFAQIAAKDWVRESLAGLKPVTAGRFVVHGAHDRTAVAGSRIGIEIEAALAFGTGHHGTTRGCLLALDRIAKSIRTVDRHPEMAATSAFTRVFDPLWRPSKGDGLGRHPSRRAKGVRLRMKGPRILDLGTGSGVLAIAAARALRARVLATDNDAAAVRAARGNARCNRAGPWIDVVRANGVNAPAIRAGAPFALVFANILLAPLQRLAFPLANIVAPGGRVVLSGLLTAQANAALAAYTAFTLERRITLEGWTTLVLQRRRRAAVARTRGGP